MNHPPRFASAIVLALLPIALRPVWWYASLIGLLRKKFLDKCRKRRILLICHNPVAADHLQPIVSLLHDHRRYGLYVANDHFPAQEISKELIKQKVRARYVPILLCLCRHWDLVIYVNHAWGFGAWLAPSLHKMYINHGLYVGKINNSLGEDGVYGHHRTHRPHRGLLYDRMLAASEPEREAALRADTSLESVVRVAGSLMVDTILAQNTLREKIREKFHTDPERPIIHVISTWGSSSLAAVTATELLREMIRLNLIGNVLLSVHPRFDKFGGTDTSRHEILQKWASAGAHVDMGNDEWKDFLIAADVAVADHSSLAFYHVALHHPLVFVPVPSENYVVGAAIERIIAAFPQLDDPSQLSTALAQAKAIGAPSYAALVERLVAWPGAAALHHLQEIDQLIFAGESGVVQRRG